MKKNVLLILLFSFFFGIAVFAQDEGVGPTWGVTLEREVALADIEEKQYQNVLIELKAADLGAEFAKGVKVVVIDRSTGKKIYKKRFSKSYLYAFPDGEIQVGKGNALTQIILYKSQYTNDWLMILKEKGIY